MENNLKEMIFFNIGWMSSYSGYSPNDPTLGGHGHLKKNRHGAESHNFAPVDGRLYGYRPPGEKKIEISRLGAGRKDHTIEGITVVWIARHPKSKDAFVVGWYKNAVVHRGTQPLPSAAASQQRLYDEFMVEADEKNCRLLPPEARTFQILSTHRRPGGFGQSPTFYDILDLYRSDVARYIASVEGNIAISRKRSTRRTRSRVDPEIRLKIERTAVDHAISYYASDIGGGWDVESVETLGKGWDLECRREDEILLVEVKGCGGSDLAAELTPNEWSKMKHPDHQNSYSLYIVTDCLSGFPVPSIFRHRNAKWQTDDGRSLSIEIREGARVRSADPR